MICWNSSKVFSIFFLPWSTIIKAQAENLYKAIQRFNLLLSEHGETLKKHTQELLCIADNLDKVSKGTKIAGITGGATSAVGGVAAVAGVALAPFTLGASLLLTVAGAGVMAAGGITGASAAIAHKVTRNSPKYRQRLKAASHWTNGIPPCDFSL
ncbi:apolipoprotein L5-like [Notothenia coriiceps]|uniref:Apolipoprotein L5-like n=1 Tax=Notothenia coriiceps TaxID=8208 RepID=A0A6I9NQ85_9TELE|nr:PREDICTED: apolipoprotein L5-like [Notothenia coriiceps]